MTDLEVKKAKSRCLVRKLLDEHYNKDSFFSHLNLLRLALLDIEMEELIPNKNKQHGNTDKRGY